MDSLMILSIWDFDEETIAMMEKAKVGDCVHIEEQAIPMVWEDTVTGERYFYGYTDRSKIPFKYLRKYAFAGMSMNYIIFAIGVYERVLGKEIKLKINPIEDEGRVFSKEELTEMQQAGDFSFGES